MNFLRELATQLTNVWNRTDTRSRIVFGTAILLSLAMVIGVARWSTRPQYVPLASDLSPQVAAEVVARLEAADIQYQMNYSGSVVLVPNRRWNEARVQVGELAETVGPPTDDLQDNFLGDPTLNRYKILRQREASLANTIRRFKGVTNATVHIGQSDPSPFIVDREPPTASIVLELSPGSTLSHEHAAAIVAVVAKAVQGLERQNVTVMDSRGRILSDGAAMADADVINNFDYRRRLEADLSSKAELMLAEMLGDGRAVVRVTADVDFRRSQRTETTFDPELKVRTRERIVETSTTGATAGDGGPAGSGSNLDANVADSGGTPISKTHNENESDYENAKTVDTVTEVPGRILRLTVAAMVDLSEIASHEGGAQPPSEEQISSIIKNAVGFDQTRGDAIEVMLTQLIGRVGDDAPGLVPQKWDLYNRLIRSGSLGVASLVALLLGWLSLRKMRPVTIEAAPAETTSGRERLLAELTQRAQDNPHAIGDVVSSWLAESGDGNTSTSDTRGRAAA